MTTHTTARNGCMIYRRTNPACCRMTRIARRSSRNVSRRQASRANTIMTTCAHTQHLGMVHCCRWRPHCGPMTDLANITGSNVAGRLIGGNHAIMTRRTSTGDLSMVNPQCGHPHIGGVTGFAKLGRRNMRRTFAASRVAVMTTAKSIHYANMTKRGAQQTYRGVTYLAVFGRGKLCRILARSHNT